MKRTLPLICGSLLVVLTGCLPLSLNPIYTDQDLVFEPGLVGSWLSEDDTWTFEKSGDKQYKLTIKAAKEARTGEFEARLMKLQGTMYLDMLPDDSCLKNTNRVEVYDFCLVPTHTFMKVRNIGKTLDVAFLKWDSFKELLAKHPKLVAHQEIADDRILLTASTPELQKFILEGLKDESMWDKSEMERAQSK